MTDEFIEAPEIAEARERRRRMREAEADFKAIREQREAVIEAEEQAAADRRGLIADTGVGIGRGIPGAFEEVFDLIATLDEEMGRKFGKIDFSVFDGDGIGFDPFVEGEDQSPFRNVETGLRLTKEMLPETERATGAIAEPITKFTVGFISGKRILAAVGVPAATTTLGSIGTAAAAGAISDVAVFDGHEERLSNMIESFPALQNPVTEFLAADEDDGEIEGRIKSVIEGAGVGILFDSLMVGLRGIRSWRRNRAIANAVEEADNAEFKIRDEPAKVTDNVADDAAEQADEARAADDAEPAKEPAKTEEELIEQRKADTRRTVEETMQITPEQARAFRQAVAEGDEAAATKVLNDFNENNIDWSKIEDADDIKQVLLNTERIFADLIDDAKGGVQSNKQTRMLANLVDATPKEIANLFRDTRGGGGIAARFYAAQRTMFASAQEVKRAAQASLDNPGSAKHEADALRALQVHAAIQAEVKGAQTEIARALQGMSIIKDAAADNYREFDELRRQFAGSGQGKTAWEKQMDELLGMRDLDQLNAKVRMTRWEKFSNMFIEYTVNSMLSSPKTHVINFVSNVLNSVLYTMDRGLGGSWRYLKHGDQQALREFRIDVWSKMSRLDEAWKLAKQAWRDGAPVTDKRQRIEFQTRMANAVEGTARDVVDADAAAKNHNSPIIARKTEVVRDGSGAVVKAVDHTVWQRVLNTLGRIVRIPGRALITGDEFFKAVNRNAEISVLAFRQADEEALAKGLDYGSDAYETFLEQRIRKLSDTNIRDPENVQIQAQAIEKSRQVTFQEAPITSFGSKAESFINSNRWFKLIVAPFFRTPMNILRQGAFDRTPLGYLFDRSKDIIKNGHPRAAAEIQARMFTGVAAMGAFYSLVSSPEEGGNIQVVGKVPFGTSAKDANIKDYSISFDAGETFNQFNRLEPMGMWLGMIADVKTAAMYGDDDDLLFAASQGAIGAFMNNVGSKTYMKSLSDIQEMFEGVKTAKPATLERAMDRFLSGEFGKLIPQIVKSGAAALEGEDRFARETWDVLDTMANRSALFNEELAPKHDNLGRPIPQDGGLSIMFNPFARSENSDDPVDKEMFRLGFTLKPMAKTLGAGAVELTAEEYSRLTGLVAETGIHDTLTALVTSEAWEGLSDPLKAALMKERITEARAAARGMFLAQPGIMQRITDAKINAASLLAPDAE